jgi:uncharacterized membrane protein YbhN (UPF0104 family)
VVTVPLLPHLVALGLVLLELGLRAWKIRLLVDPGRALAVNAYGDAAAAVTPGRLGGDPARFIGFGRCGLEPSARLVGLGAEKIIDGFVLAVLGTLLVAAFGGRGLRGAVQTLSQLGTRATIVVCVLFVVFLALGLWGVLWYRRRHATNVSRQLRKLWTHARDLSARTWLTAGMLTVVGTLARVAVLPVLCFGVVPAADLGVVALGSFALLYSQLVLPTPSGAGGVELGFAVGFSSSLDPAQVATLLVAWRCYTLLVPAGLGGVLLARIVVTRRLAQAAGVLVVLGTVGAAATGAQEPLGSRNLPYDHWAYEYVERLRPRGYLANLNPLVQPYRRLEVARGLVVGLDPAELPEPVSHWVRMLRDELSSELARLEGSETGYWGIDLSGGARASTSKRLHVLRPTGDEDIWPWYTAGGWVEGGPIAFETRLLADRYLLQDPDGDDPGQRRYGRTDNAYVSVTLPFGSISAGRMKRNWAALGSDGLMISDVATAYPQLSLEFTIGRVSLRSMTGELESIDEQKRYIAGHRLDYQTDNLVLSFGESILYAGTSGLSLRFLNPAEFLFFDSDNAPDDFTQNLMLNGQIWLRAGRWNFVGSVLLDDIDVIGDELGAPTRYALEVGTRTTVLGGTADLDLSYQRVSSFAYRTNRIVDKYSYLERGLGSNYSDYDLVTLMLDVYPGPRGLRLSPVAQVQRQGEGGIREPFPPYAEFRTSPSLFLGVVETTLRLGLRGRYQPLRHFWLGWDLGENFVRNARSVEDDSVTEFTAVIEIGGTVSLPLP